MDIFSKYPIITQIMCAEREEDPAAYNPNKDFFYQQAESSRRLLNESLEKLLLEYPDGGEKVKQILHNLDSTASDMEGVAENYAFVCGFKMCAKLIFEMLT